MVNKVFDREGLQRIHLTVLFLRLATRQTTYGNTWCISCDHLFAALPPQIQIETSLDDAEQILRFWLLVRSYAPV